MSINIIFQGPGPFHLPTMQFAKADGYTNNGVTLLMFCVLPGRGREPEALNIQMTSAVARETAVTLIQAAQRSETGVA